MPTSFDHDNTPPVATTLAGITFDITGPDLAVIPGVAPLVRVRCASTEAINIGAALVPVDGQTLGPLDRVLLKDQTNAAQNGVYVRDQYQPALRRPAPGEPGYALASGQLVGVDAGTVNGGKCFVLATPNPIVPDTTEQVWTENGAA
jgi:hypothetical protein